MDESHGEEAGRGERPIEAVGRRGREGRDGGGETGHEKRSEKRVGKRGEQAGWDVRTGAGRSSTGTGSGPGELRRPAPQAGSATQVGPNTLRRRALQPRSNRSPPAQDHIHESPASPTQHSPQKPATHR